MIRVLRLWKALPNHQLPALTYASPVGTCTYRYDSINGGKIVMQI